MKLLIVSHTPHYMQNGLPVGWGPTVREIDQLAQLFESVIHLAVLYNEPAPQNSLGYQADNVQFMPVHPAGGATWMAKLGVLAAYPGYWKSLHAALGGIDHSDCIHVRCPANLSLLTILWLGMTRKPKYRWVKYAGNWQPIGKEPFFYKLQRRLLVQDIHHGMVTVNGRWKNQQSHVLSFYNPSIHTQEIEVAKAGVRQKEIGSPVQILFVGALNNAKGAGRVLQIAAILKSNGILFKLHMIGDGQEKTNYEAWVKEQHLEGMVAFHGWLRRSELISFYELAHLNILPSASEGWPKVLSEGMAYGVVPLAGAVSSIPQILEELQSGRAFDPHDLEGFVEAIQGYLTHPQRWKSESLAGLRAAEQFTYERYLQQVADMFDHAWGIRLLPR